MEFHVGECVVYPNHGVAIVEAISNWTIAGGQLHGYQLRLLASNTVVMVPLANATVVGLRRTVGRSEVAPLLEQLRASRGAAQNGDWKGRFKENSERMRSGRLSDIAEVVRGLTGLARQRSLSFREKNMLDKARELMVAEIAAAAKLSPESVSAQLNEALGIAPTTAN